MLRTILFCSGLALSSMAHAEDAADYFTGPLIGAEAGLAQHNFSLVVFGPGPTNPNNPPQTRSVKSQAIGGVAFAGYDFKIGSHLIIGAEAALHAGGKNASTVVTPNTFTIVGIDPKLGYSLTARIGYAPTDKFLLFGRAGYGGHRYGDIGPSSFGVFGTNNSFVLGGGAEYRVGRKLAARLDLRHLDGSRNEILVGVLTRF